MRILDEQGQELTPEEVDLELGYLREEQIITEIPEKTHYAVGRIYFDDNTSYQPSGEDDPRIKIIDAEKGQFEYIPEEGSTKTYRGMNIKLIVDQPYEKQSEDIQRYIKYTEEELTQRTLPDRVSSVEQTLEETGVTVEDLILLMAEVLGGEEESLMPEESVEETSEEPVKNTPEEPVEETSEE